MRRLHSDNLVEQLRQRACPPEGEYLEHDHGHSDCYLEREAADEIETLRGLADDLDERCTELRAETERLRSVVEYQLCGAHSDEIAIIGTLVRTLDDRRTVLRSKLALLESRAGVRWEGPA